MQPLWKCRNVNVCWILVSSDHKDPANTAVIAKLRVQRSRSRRRRSCGDIRCGSGGGGVCLRVCCVCVFGIFVLEVLLNCTHVLLGCLDLLDLLGLLDFVGLAKC